MRKVSKLLNGQKIVPVVVLEDSESTLGLCQALLTGGVKVIEVTLRNAYGLTAIKQIKQEFPEMVVLAGTVNTATDMYAVAEAGVDGVISPGVTPTLLRSAADAELPYMPGVATGSEILTAIEHGLEEVKLFPATVVGGVSALKAFAGPFPGIRFCPTGGIGESDFADYLALDNVMCVGGSWLAPPSLIKAGEWEKITQLCKNSINSLSQD
jgi:2-dehydro-3-deoxyphosphogluconate aldolase/(4S)-4-hydroxy-2-oxoglutarate aldolase